MEIKSKKTIGGIVLASILVAGMFTLTPQNASADLTVLDGFDTLLAILIDIQNIVLDIQNTVNNIFNEITDPEHGLEEVKREVRIIETNVTSSEHGLKEIKREVRNIEGNVTSPDFGLEEIKNEVRNIEGNVTAINATVTDIQTDLLLKKRFYQFVNDTDTELGGGGSGAIFARIRVVDCAPELQAVNACAFNVESLLIYANATQGNGTVAGPVVDGMIGPYEVRIVDEGIEIMNGLSAFIIDDNVNFLIEACVIGFINEEETCILGPPGFLGASNEIGVIIFINEGVLKIEKIEFNGQQPQGMQLELVVEEFGEV